MFKEKGFNILFQVEGMLAVVVVEGLLAVVEGGGLLAAVVHDVSEWQVEELLIGVSLENGIGKTSLLNSGMSCAVSPNSSDNPFNSGNSISSGSSGKLPLTPSEMSISGGQLSWQRGVLT